MGPSQGENLLGHATRNTERGAHRRRRRRRGCEARERGREEEGRPGQGKRDRTVGRRGAAARGYAPRSGTGAQAWGRVGSRAGAATFFAFLPRAHPGGRYLRGTAPAANIFLMSSRGLKPARSALQGGFVPRQMFREETACEAPREEGDKSLPPSARARDFLLKFKRKTGFLSAPKNVFLADNGLLSAPPRAGAGAAGAGTVRRGPAEAHEGKRALRAPAPRREGKRPAAGTGAGPGCSPRSAPGGAGHARERGLTGAFWGPRTRPPPGHRAPRAPPATSTDSGAPRSHPSVPPPPRGPQLAGLRPASPPSPLRGLGGQGTPGRQGDLRRAATD